MQLHYVDGREPVFLRIYPSVSGNWTINEYIIYTVHTGILHCSQDSDSNQHKTMCPLSKLCLSTFVRVNEDLEV